MLSTNPFAAPLVERGTTGIRLTLEAQVARIASAEWLQAGLDDAVAKADADRAEMLLALATELDRSVERAAAEALVAKASAPLAQAAACGACMADIANCESLRLVAACAVPFELSPLGDVNALRRAASRGAQDAALGAGSNAQKPI